MKGAVNKKKGRPLLLYVFYAVLLSGVFTGAVVFGVVKLLTEENSRKKTGAELRYEALGYHEGRVRMVHPNGRSILIPRSQVPEMKRVGWILKPHAEPGEQ